MYEAACRNCRLQSHELQVRLLWCPDRRLSRSRAPAAHVYARRAERANRVEHAVRADAMFVTARITENVWKMSRSPVSRAIGTSYLLCKDS